MIKLLQQQKEQAAALPHFSVATAPFSLSISGGKRSAAVAQQLSGWETPPEDGETREQLPTVKTFPGEGAEEAEGEK